MNRISKILLAACVAAAVAGCTDPAKIPSEAAIKGADAAFQAVKAEAEKYVPAETKALGDTLADAKAKYAAQKYKEALAAAGTAAQEAKALAAAAAAKKEQLTKAFNDVASQLPPLMETAKAKLEELKKAKKLPKGLDKAALEKANATFAELASGLDAATASFKSGALQDAATAANALPPKAQELLASLGVQPAPAK